MTDAGPQIQTQDRENVATENAETDAIVESMKAVEAVENAEADAALDAAADNGKPSTSWDDVKQELDLEDRKRQRAAEWSEAEGEAAPDILSSRGISPSWESEVGFADRGDPQEPPDLLEDAELAIVSSRGLRYLLGGLIADGAKPTDLRVWLSSIVEDDHIWASLDEQWEALQMTPDKVDDEVAFGYMEGEDASLEFDPSNESSS